MSDDPQDLEGWGRRAASALRDSEAIDAAVSRRLASARVEALAAARRPRRLRLPGASLAALLAALVFLPLELDAPPPPLQMAAADALEVLADEQDPQFYEDLELYLWLDEDEHA